MAGDCFSVAAHLAIDPGSPYENVRVCHGLAVGVGPVNNGKRFWHAWIEYEMQIEGCPPLTFVVDKANGCDTLLPQAYYYELGEIETVYRYEPVEAATLMVTTGHYGPWIPEWESMCEVRSELV